MGPQRYAAVGQHDLQNDDNDNSPINTSPPPSFHSRGSSPTSRRLLHEDPVESDADRDLNDAFNDSDDEDGADDRQRLMRSDTSRSVSLAENTSIPMGSPPSLATQPPRIERRVTEIPAFRPQPTSTRVIPGVTAPRPAADGVFANLSAKLQPGEVLEDKPPTYEQAALDATPPYWETTILAPGLSDEVYINGLPVGSLFSFIWNGMISMSFLFPGFLLTYLLHTTHAAKNGSLAGLGLTLVQYGFYMRGGKDAADPGAADPGQFNGNVPDPNSHTFDPSNPTGGQSHSGADQASSGFASGDLISYGLMIIGWFILIRAVSSFLRARREEQLVLQSPARGLNQPVVAQGEGDQAV